MADVFNNPTNNYVYPGLSPCVKAADDSYFEFVGKGEVNILTGSLLDVQLDLSSISIPINGWNQKSIIISSGEVIYIPGLTKGLCRRKQGFIIPDLNSNDENLESYFMQIDLSINYYDNFKYKSLTLEASSNYDQNIDIAIALNQEFNNKNIKISATYDLEKLTFTANQSGYDFNINNIELTTIDASEHEDSPFIDSSTLILKEDKNDNIPHVKYLNGALRGLFIKNTFPESDTNEEDWWLYINHTQNYITSYDYIQDISINNTDVSIYKKVTKRLDVGKSTESTDTVMSGGDYLEMITEENKWKKVSDIYAWTAAEDDSNCETSNLINGFYIFNPQNFSIKIDYIIFV